MYLKVCVYPVVNITRPPPNGTVCRGNGAAIRCGYQSNTTFPVTWIINGTLFTQEQLMNNSLFRLNNPTSPPDFSLTMFYINDTITFQCIVQSSPNTTSTVGTVKVTGTCVCTYCVYTYVIACSVYAFIYIIIYCVY